MGFLFYFMLGGGIMLVSRIWQQQKIAQLDAAYKQLLVKLFSKKNYLSVIISLASMVLFIIIILLNIFEIKLALFGFAIVNILAQAIPLNINYNKLIEANFPAEFVKNYLITSAINVLGTIIIFSYLFFENPNI